MSKLPVPPAPSSQSRHAVQAWREPVTIPTYEPASPDRLPMFLEKRVYQGSTGRVYPLPVYDRVAETAVPKSWDAFHLENEFVRVMVLPEIRGRVHLFRDKTTGYDAIYRQDVIKPALVALAGPWISGGIEFNWPQHHGPATYMPVETHLERHDDGSVTLWCSDHDPLNRLKGMHGICLHPGRSVLELKVRLYNRTPFTQTFLWWANVATEVHEQYQSFFPPDVGFIADHAKRATATFPRVKGSYYGVDYGKRGREGVPADEQPSKYRPDPRLVPPDDLSWYANIPVPTSYMCTGTTADFFGGYDHRVRAGLMHVASHHVSPGKKQWTWGNHDFGYAWDRLLTDPDEHGAHRPYIELMAGVFTDNQPDFTFLAPGETKTFRQFWYPFREIGPAVEANERLALALRIEKGVARVGIAASETIAVRCLVRRGEKTLADATHAVSPDRSATFDVRLEPRTRAGELSIELLDAGGATLLRYTPREPTATEPPPPATEPPPPEQIAGSDELYLTGVHLEQYRHATRMPERYWREALRRDPLDSRCNTAMGRWHLRRGELESAESHLRRAIERQTRRNPNPATGEALYLLGLTLRFMGRPVEALDPLHKATWNVEQRSAAQVVIAEIEASRGRHADALAAVEAALRLNLDDLRARDLQAHLLRKLGDDQAADSLLRQTLAIDPLDSLARFLLDGSLPDDPHARLDVAIDLTRWGEHAAALAALEGCEFPMRDYHVASLQQRLGRGKDAARSWKRAAAGSYDYLFPARLEDEAVLREAIDRDPADARARYALGNYLYDRRRHEEAIDAWTASARLDPSHAGVHRNLGIGLFNVRRDPAAAKRAYDRAVACEPTNPRLVYERDQLRKRLGESPARRLRSLEADRPLIARRDDLSVEYASLLNLVGRHREAREVLLGRNFQPWEGGEGQALGQFVAAQVAMAIEALPTDPQASRRLLEEALDPPDSLGEKRHLLANLSHVHHYLGVACERCGDPEASKRHHTLAADFTGDFQGMSVRAFSEMTYYSALSQRALGRGEQATQTLRDLLAWSRQLEKTPATIDYFATSLPTMLLFDDDLQLRQTIAARVMQAQALLGLGRREPARALLEDVLKLDPSHALAAGLHRELARPPARGSRSRR